MRLLPGPSDQPLKSMSLDSPRSYATGDELKGRRQKCGERRDFMPAYLVRDQT